MGLLVYLFSVRCDNDSGLIQFCGDFECFVFVNNWTVVSDTSVCNCYRHAVCKIAYYTLAHSGVLCLQTVMLH